MQDRRQDQPEASFSKELADKGKQQLKQEISVIEDWLEDLKETRDDNPESVAARQSYSDMLQSRKDLLSALEKKES